MKERVTRVRAALRDRVGRRGAALLFFAMLDLVYAWAMVTAYDNQANAPLNPTYAWFNGVAPLPVWACAWALVGAMCLFHALHWYDRYGFVAAIGIKMVWGLLSFAGWALEDVSLGSVAIWWGLAGLVWVISGWPEPDVTVVVTVDEDEHHDD